MKKFIASCLIGGGLILGSVVGASAAADHSMPGTPGDANCVGQTNAFLAQAYKNGQLPGDEAFHGLGGLAGQDDISVQQFQQVVQTYCTTLP